MPVVLNVNSLTNFKFSRPPLRQSFAYRVTRKSFEIYFPDNPPKFKQLGIHKGHIYKRLEPLPPLYNIDRKLEVKKPEEQKTKEGNILENSKGQPDHHKIDRIPKIFNMDQIPILAEPEKPVKKTPVNLPSTPIVRSKRTRRAPDRLQF